MKPEGSGKGSALIMDSGDVKGDEVKRELTKINNLNEKNKLNNLNNTFQQISKLLTNLEAKNQLVMKGLVKGSGTALNILYSDLSEIRNTMNNLSEMKRLPANDEPEVRNEDGATHRRERRRAFVAA